MPPPGRGPEVKSGIWDRETRLDGGLTGGDIPRSEQVRKGDKRPVVGNQIVASSAPQPLTHRGFLILTVALAL